ncbi:hypothetical protein MTR67_043746 [Solanum verrucosum]|uniref:Uncharacterized protein n=1 Tax=Solanum verrucosum TaxID=315347 RepID=A0AAF0US03_SOLVR|nr:hypothetical protein MTR67_043746 [Solanum verrucosum]
MHMSYGDRRRQPLRFSVGDRIFLLVSPMKGVMRFWRQGKHSPRRVVVMMTSRLRAQKAKAMKNNKLINFQVKTTEPQTGRGPLDEPSEGSWEIANVEALGAKCWLKFK